jgi:dCMP deaminase
MAITPKDEYYMGIARSVAQGSKCIRANVGAIVVKNDQVISTGYSGAPRGQTDCKEIGKCFRTEHNIPSGSDYLKCRSVHAEMNACLHAGRERTMGSTMYMSGYKHVCEWCARVMINAGVELVVIQEKEGDDLQIHIVDELIFTPADVEEWVAEQTGEWRG